MKTLKRTESAWLSYSEGSFMDFEESEDNGNPTVSSSDEDGTWVKKIRIKKPSKYKGRTICKYCPCCVKMMNCILNNKCYMVFMTLVTLYALFMDDIRILTCPIGVDEILWGVTSGAFGLFIFELLLSSLAMDGYLCNFYFWLDLIATVSLISDIGWIWNQIFP